MLPTITGLYAGLSTFLIILLTFNVIRNRMIAHVGLGDGGNETLRVAIRIHGNAVEYLPLALLLMAIVEMENGIAGGWLHVLGILLIVGRILHIQGLMQNPGTSMGRRLGIVLTMFVLLVLSVCSVIGFFGL